MFDCVTPVSTVGAALMDELLSAEGGGAGGREAEQQVHALRKKATSVRS